MDRRRIFSIIVPVFFVLSQLIPVGYGAEDDKTSTAAISFTRVPQYGSNENLEGRVLSVENKGHAIAVYIMVNGSWWIKPFWDQPLTAIQANGTWCACQAYMGPS